MAGSLQLSYDASQRQCLALACRSVARSTIRSSLADTSLYVVNRRPKSLFQIHINSIYEISFYVGCAVETAAR
jgi:hypothetical protein